jgi:hypothetical protein
MSFGFIRFGSVSALAALALACSPADDRILEAGAYTVEAGPGITIACDVLDEDTVLCRMGGEGRVIAQINGEALIALEVEEPTLLRFLDGRAIAPIDYDGWYTRDFCWFASAGHMICFIDPPWFPSTVEKVADGGGYSLWAEGGQTSCEPASEDVQPTVICEFEGTGHFEVRDELGRSVAGYISDVDMAFTIHLWPEGYEFEGRPAN